MLTVTSDHPTWCDLEECDVDPGTGRGCHQARPMNVAYHDQSRSSASMIMVQSPGEAQTWICIESRTVDVREQLAEHALLLAPEQARILGRHLLRAGREAIAGSPEVVPGQ